MAEVIPIQSAQLGQNPNGSLEERHRVKAQGAQLRKSENKGIDWRSGS
jgi:hypothetical protein